MISCICLCLNYFTWYDHLWVHPCCCKWHYLILFYGWVIFHCVYTPYLLYPFICRLAYRLLAHKSFWNWFSFWCDGVFKAVDDEVVIRAKKSSNGLHKYRSTSYNLANYRNLWPVCGVGGDVQREQKWECDWEGLCWGIPLQREISLLERS